MVYLSCIVPIGFYCHYYSFGTFFGKFGLTIFQTCCKSNSLNGICNRLADNWEEEGGKERRSKGKRLPETRKAFYDYCCL